MNSMPVRAFLLLAALAACLASAPAHALGTDGGVQSNVQASGNDVVKLTSTAEVAYLNAYDHATINYSGPRVSWSYFYDQSVANVFRASTISWMLLHDSSTANIHGGTISWLKLYQNSQAHLRSATDVSWLLLSQQAQAHMYVRNFDYSHGHLSGRWASGAAFDFWALNERDLPTGNFSSVLPEGLRMHVVPEPAAWLLAALLPALVVLRARRGRAA
jgi:hypothetical protein